MSMTLALLKGDKQILKNVLVTSVETKTASVALQLLAMYGTPDGALVDEIRSK